MECDPALNRPTAARAGAPLLALALALVFGLPATGCRREEPSAAVAQPFEVVHYQDLVVDQALYGTFDPATGVHTCADESRDSFVLVAGERRAFTVELEKPYEELLRRRLLGRSGRSRRSA